MSEENIVLHLVGKKDDMAELFGTPAQFTDNQSGAPTYLKSVYVKASEKKVIARGASEISAIEMSMDSLEVRVPGEGLFLALNINTIISTFDNDDTIELIGYEGGEYIISQTDGPRSASDKSVAITSSTYLPEVGSFHEDNFIAIDPEEFTSAFGIASNSVSEGGRSPIFNGIYYERSGDNLVMTGGNGGSLSTFLTVPLSTEKKTPEDANIAGLLHSANTASRSALMRAGDLMTIHSSDDSSAHFLIYSKGEVIYHMRISQLDSGTRKYPANMILGSTLNHLNRSSRHSVTLDRHDLIELLGNGVTIGSLDQMSEMGSHRQVNLYLERADETDPSSVISVTGRVYSGNRQTNSQGEVGYSGDLRFEDSFEVEKASGFEHEKLAFSLHYGLYGSVIRSIPIEGPITMNFVVMKSKIAGVIIYETEDGKEINFDGISADPKQNATLSLDRTPKFLTFFALNSLYVKEYED